MRRALAKSADFSVVLPQTVFRKRWTEPVNRVKTAEAARLEEIKKQPRKSRHPLGGANQWRKEMKGELYLKALFVEGELEKKRQHVRFEERLNHYGNLWRKESREKPKGVQHVDMFTSAKHSWRGEAVDSNEYRALLYEEGVKEREERGTKYFDLVLDASRCLPGCIDLSKTK